MNKQIIYKDSSSAIIKINDLNFFEKISRKLFFKKNAWYRINHEKDFENNNVYIIFYSGNFFLMLKHKVSTELVFYDNHGNIVDLLEEFDLPEQIFSEIEKIQDSSDFYNILLKLSRGKISQQEIQLLESEVYEVKFNKSNPPQSLIVLDYDKDADNSNFLKVLGFDSNDLYTFENFRNGDYEFLDWYAAKEEFLDGHVLNNERIISEENLELLNKITLLMYGVKIDDNSKIGHDFYERFNGESEDIIDIYKYLMNTWQNESSYDAVEGEIDNALEKLKLKKYNGYSYISIKAIDLILWYNMSYGWSILPNEVIEKIVKFYKIDLGGVSDSAYEYGSSWDTLDTTYFNRKLNTILENILESFVPDSFFDKVYSIRERYPFDVYHKLPKNPEILFKIKGVDKEKNRILLNFESEKGRFDSNNNPIVINLINNFKSIPIDNFYTFLNSKDLFLESKKKL